MIFRSVLFAKCIFLSQCALLNYGLVDHDSFIKLLELFVPTFSVYDATVTAIKDIKCLCDHNEIHEEAKILKIQEIC